jgi:hypothetical protein
MSSSDPHSTHNVDTSRAPRGVRELVMQVDVELWVVSVYMDKGLLGGVQVKLRGRWITQLEQSSEWSQSADMSRSLNSVWGGRFRVAQAWQGVGVKDVRIHLEVDKHAGEPWSLPSLSLYTGEGSANITN